MIYFIKLFVSQKRKVEDIRADSADNHENEVKIIMPHFITDSAAELMTWCQARSVMIDGQKIKKLVVGNYEFFKIVKSKYKHLVKFYHQPNYSSKI